MVRVKFLQDAAYTDDGFTVLRGMKGETREVDVLAAQELCKWKKARLVGE